VSPGGPRDRSDGAGASGPFSLSGLLAAAPDLAAALPGIERAAGSDAPLLLIGEPGTGRSTLARAIHGAGPRAGGPLVEADAASLPSTLFESELFGYRPGAFTGADRPRDGRVARAEGGTLVLDHLEELPRTIQPKLLRLIAERRYAPLGGSEREAEVRFLALAAEDLPERIDRGAFRADLYYRLEVLAFRLPPLRHRRRDLPGVVETLLADLRQRLGRPGVELAPAASEWIVEHPWPGNLTQLRSVLERALILHEDGPLEPEPPEEGGDRPRPLVEMEKAEIRRALAYTRGHQGRAAELLGISRKALWEKRKRHGIP
jgi:DNA-binding NtrC family response regulator